MLLENNDYSQFDLSRKRSLSVALVLQTRKSIMHAMSSALILIDCSGDGWSKWSRKEGRAYGGGAQREVNSEGKCVEVGCQ